MWEYNYYNPNELYHYGVPGMKWGRRKARYDQGYTSVRQARRDARAAYRSQVNTMKAQKIMAKYNTKAQNKQVKAQNTPTPEQRAARIKQAVIKGKTYANKAADLAKSKPVKALAATAICVAGYRYVNNVYKFMPNHYSIR